SHGRAADRNREADSGGIDGGVRDVDGHEEPGTCGPESRGEPDRAPAVDLPRHGAQVAVVAGPGRELAVSAVPPEADLRQVAVAGRSQIDQVEAVQDVALVSVPRQDEVEDQRGP